MKRTYGQGVTGAVAIAFATLPLLVMAWVAHESALTALV
jgi:hypothetical protein